MTIYVLHIIHQNFLNHLKNMLLAATVVLFLMSMPAYQTMRILYREEQNFMMKNQVPPISEPNPPTTTDTPHSRISPKTLASDHTDVSSSLGGVQYPPHVLVPPSAPSTCTYIPSPTVSYNTALSLGTPQTPLLPSMTNGGTCIP